MSNYTIWKSDNDNELLVEVYNECDVDKVQIEFIEKGYYVAYTSRYYYHYLIYFKKK